MMQSHFVRFTPLLVLSPTNKNSGSKKLWVVFINEHSLSYKIFMARLLLLVTTPTTAA